MKLFLILILSISNAFAVCNYKVNSKDIKLEWIAFKTAKKIGVKGSFKDLGLNKGIYQGTKLSTLLKDVKFKIKTNSIDTNNKGRDKTIYTNFFKIMTSDIIEGKIKNYSKGFLNIELNLNGVKKLTPLRVDLSEDEFNAVGTIDVFDFSLNKSLSSINKVCYEMHAGKTWNDVDIELSFNFNKECD